MQSEQKVMRVNLYINEEKDVAYTAGVELYNRVDGKPVVHYVMSLYFPYDEWRSKREVMDHVMAKILKQIDDVETIIFYSVHAHFEKWRKIDRRIGVFAPGKFRIFKRISKPDLYTVMLAMDALSRGESLECEI
jgi:hypothetical protein